MMDSHDAWRLGPPPVSRHIYSHDTMGPDVLTYIQRNQLCLWISSNQSVLLPIAILVASVLFSSNILDILAISAVTVLPKKTQETLWDLLVTALPGSFLFWLEDKMAPTKGGRAPKNFHSKTIRHLAKSATLSIILELGDRGRRTVFTKIWTERFNRFTRSVITNGDPNGLRGLENPQNKCYRNTILQGLSSMDSVAQYLRAALDRRPVIGAPKAQAQALATVRSLDHLVTLLREPAGTTPVLASDPILEMIHGDSQQDAQEYLLKLLDSIETELKNAAIIHTKASLVFTPPSTTIDERQTSLEAVSMSRADSIASGSSEATVTSNTGHANGDSDTTAPAPDFRLPLEALVAERKVCKVCNYSEGMSLDPTCCITLSLPYKGSPHYQDAYYLEELLSIHCEGEVLEGVNCSNCTLLKLRDELLQERESILNNGGEGEDETDTTELEARLEEIQNALSTKTFDDNTLINKCKVKNSDYVRADKAKEIGFASAPPGLAIQINRSSFDYRAKKDSREVNFPRRLDFSPWCLGSSFPDPLHSIDVSNLQGTDKETVEKLEHRSKKPVYMLRCAVMHRGAHNGGHYFCYRQNRTMNSEKEQDTDPSSALSGAVRSGRTAHKERSPSVFDDNDSVTVAGSEYEVSRDRDSAGEETDEDREPAHKKRKLVAKSVEEQEDEEEDAPWWVLSDESTSRRPEDAVFGQPSLVYMLFYDRVFDDAEDSTAVEAEVTKIAIRRMSGDSTKNQSVAENPTVDDTTVEDTTVEDATVENATVENATVENATVEDATVEDATVEDVEDVTTKVATSESDTEDESQDTASEASGEIRWTNDTTTEVENEVDPSVDDTEDEQEDVTTTYAKQNVVAVAGLGLIYVLYPGYTAML
ncbi:ubiquitin carboxyl-terminal hydrolase [Ophiostoma piceae UAMH 11346]|uniref:ubiquitinyl hydrolase 1 n=1 Tax=Ophiostoma piceae (strain UAMH 11346) TaxID=1262450 RepID=S3BUW6_OPHP1|nr:ubiquitin carboxyl-terminal hydrolase [Ophiostoma piceae UAMH 11346]